MHNYNFPSIPQRLDPTQYYLLSNNGRKITDETPCANEIQLVLKVFGGKGGFGSNLRSVHVEKTTNVEACRDLSGRRLRDIHTEQRLKTWMEKKKNEILEDANEKFKRAIQKLQALPKVEVPKIDYVKIEDTHDAVEQGLKRKAVKSPEKKAPKKIKGAVWIDESLSSASSDSEEEQM